MFVVSVLKLPWKSAIRSITSNASGSAESITSSFKYCKNALNVAKKTSRQETERIIKSNLIDLPSTHLSDLSADEE